MEGLGLLDIVLEAAKGSALWYGREAVCSTHVLPCPAVLGWALVTAARH